MTDPYTAKFKLPKGCSLGTWQVDLFYGAKIDRKMPEFGKLSMCVTGLGATPEAAIANALRKRRKS